MPEPMKMNGSGVYPPNPIAVKQCSGPCGRTLPATHFWKHKDTHDGLRSLCKDCAMARYGRSRRGVPYDTQKDILECSRRRCG